MPAAVVARHPSGRWIKGTRSPNPKGRRFDDPALLELARSHGPAAIGALAQLGGIATDAHGKRVAGARSESVRVSALNSLLDRGFGTPRQSVALTTEGSVEWVIRIPAESATVEEWLEAYAPAHIKEAKRLEQQKAAGKIIDVPLDSANDDAAK